MVSNSTRSVFVTLGSQNQAPALFFETSLVTLSLSLSRSPGLPLLPDAYEPTPPPFPPAAEEVPLFPPLPPPLPLPVEPAVAAVLLLPPLPTVEVVLLIGSLTYADACMLGN